MIRFLIESSICLGLFYGVYWVFLRKEKLLSLNRFYLIGAVLISMVIPLLEFSFYSNWISPIQAVYELFPVQGTVGGEAAGVNNSIELFSITNLYMLGLLASGVILIFRFYQALKHSGLARNLKKKGVRVVNSEGYQAFSFLNTIVLGSEIERDPDLKQTIMLHEMAHVKGRHSLDLLLMEVLKCLYWFNPFIYLTLGALKIQHEYIADAHVLKAVSPNTYERSLATITLGKIDQSLVHGFAKLPLEQRIKMIYNTNSNVMNKLKLLIALPVMALLVFQFSCTEDSIKPFEDSPEFIMKATVQKTVHGLNIISEGVAVRDDKLFKLHGIVKDGHGNVLRNVKVVTSESEKEALTGDDGTFSIMITDEDQALMLSHPNKNPIKVNLSESVAPITIGTIEIPDGIKYDASLIREEANRLSSGLKEEQEIPLKFTEFKRGHSSKKNYTEVEEVVFEEPKKKN